MAVNFLFLLWPFCFFSFGRLYLEMFIGKFMDFEGSKRRSWTKGIFISYRNSKVRCIVCQGSSSVYHYYYSAGSRGGARGAHPPIFRPNWGPKGRKNFFWRPPPLPLSKCVDDWTPLPLSQGPALQCIIVFHLNELLLIVTRLVYCPYVRNFRYSLWFSWLVINYRQFCFK